MGREYRGSMMSDLRHKGDVWITCPYNLNRLNPPPKGRSPRRIRKDFRTWSNRIDRLMRSPQFAMAWGPD